ncbi:bifunctional 4-hydroxy-2-oxoglutarate aldolase/2-dehydro-3-deoxy-phosphogluconate aldolase [Lysobacter niastensis]|uniref:2-dehydro-3-deoxy-phosphogluconate aldolase n=1 Tax=Lysobacter niastensis TaxID=380629 RepID=A0ABS0BDU4_9GAMM|nr:bifunctional 4-hydroxy-2-oxoglutarate aldolase/2-dehydro-3-deoxy-phosphogluconate aldolase [Lysobacter niastensis]MBF6025290.1 bifunctional 4-hydroxy-2-oxoglutarate aldolase/2-dehydro-3-deoxy-phosphogluconate aldolase [Lysobacter niastensis]
MSAVDAEAALRGHRVIPVYTPVSEDEAVAVARALSRGGIGAIEVTLRTPKAIDAIAAIARDVPEMIVGAGTVLEVAQLHDAQRAGAKFAVSPGSLDDLLAAARDSGMPYLPGVATGSEVMKSLQAGFRLLKVFPAEAINARALIAAWQGPFPQVRFCPTGGIDAERARDYLALPNVACLGGSWLTPKGMLERGDWAHIEVLARAAARL